MLDLEHTVPIEIAESIRAWAAVTEASGTATADEIAGQVPVIGAGIMEAVTEDPVRLRQLVPMLEAVGEALDA